jgi:uncharacterized protein involved in response to NO
MQWSAPKPTRWIDRVIDQPHQPFFIAAIFWAVVMMLGTFLSLIGVSMDFGMVHGFGLIYGVFVSAFLGFLFTVIPKYTTSTPIATHLYLRVWGLFQIGILLALTPLNAAGKLLVGAALLFGLYHLLRTARSGEAIDKRDSYTLIGLVAIGALLPPLSLAIGFNLTLAAFWLVVAPIFLVVAQRMVPAFYRIYFEEPEVLRPVWFVPASLAGLYLVGLAETSGALAPSGAIGAFVAATLIGSLTLKLRPWRKANAILWILPLGLAWLSIGLFVVGYELLSGAGALKPGLHIVAIGGLLTLLVGFGTRVILGHSGQIIRADRFAVTLFGLVQALLLVRLGASLSLAEIPAMATGLLHLSAWGWIVLFILWAFRHGKTLLRLKR